MTYEHIEAKIDELKSDGYYCRWDDERERYVIYDGNHIECGVAEEEHEAWWDFAASWG